MNFRLSLRAWSVRHAGFLETFYRLFAFILVRLDPLWQKIGYERAETPVRFVERHTKALLFDCRMCGQCILSSTGMSCPMNCPKNLRNGPCGGVRSNGHCEVAPDMPCVWVQAWRGTQKMKDQEGIKDVQPALRNTFRNTSTWLRTTRDTVSEMEAMSQEEMKDEAKDFSDEKELAEGKTVSTEAKNLDDSNAA